MSVNIDSVMASASLGHAPQAIDTSTDRTQSIMKLVKTFAPDYDNLHALHNASNKGKGKDAAETASSSNGHNTFWSERSLNLSPAPVIDPQAPSATDLEVRASHFPDLALSSRIISVTFCLPHDFLYTHGEKNPWVIKRRPGKSSLYQSFEFLSSKSSSWKHILIGWTGELSQRKTSSSLPLPHRVRDVTSPPIKKSAAVNAGPSLKEMDPILHVTRSDRASLEEQLSASPGVKMIPVWLSNNAPDDADVATFSEQAKWRHYTEHELYQVFHYRDPSIRDAADRANEWKHFQAMNRTFADRILEHYRPGDLVIVHDYQLMLVPGILRARVPDIKISFYLHVLFPSFELFRTLSHRKLLLDGILGADLIGFQALPYVDHFQVCCQKLVPQCAASIQAILLPAPNARAILLETMPLGINNQSLSEDLWGNPHVESQILKLKAQFGDQRVILGRDRVDGVRGVINKLHAFRELLKRFPRWQKRVVLIQIMSPLSIEDCERGGMDTLKEITKEVDQINSQFESFGWRPIYLFTRYVQRHEYLALLRYASIGLITSVREGMSTTALEYALAQKDDHGVLLLSEFSGTSTHLLGALRLNPLDRHTVAQALNDTLSMSQETRSSLYTRITPVLDSSPLQSWMSGLITKMCLHLEEHEALELREALGTKAQESYGASAKRLLIFDYDGTLTPIVETPESALPSDEMLSRLTALAANEQNMVWIVSGRAQAFLTQHLGHIPRLGFSAEHGCFIKAPGEASWTSLASEEEMGWRPLVLNAMQNATAACRGSHVEEKNVSITWHYRQAKPVIGENCARMLHRHIKDTLGARFNVEIMAGKANLEVRPRNISKGQVVRHLLNMYGRAEEGQREFVLCVGDDTTDEDMFRALRRSDIPLANLFGVHVGGKQPTLAGYTLEDVAEVVDLLGALVDVDASLQKDKDQVTNEGEGAVEETATANL